MTQMVRGYFQVADLNTLALEVTYRVCKVCGVEHKRFDGGRYPNAKDVRFVDENGRQWNGAVCPSCHSTRVALQRKAKRDKKRARRKLYV
jgi:hypothetical protein